MGKEQKKKGYEGTRRRNMDGHRFARGTLSRWGSHVGQLGMMQ